MRKVIAARAELKAFGSWYYETTTQHGRIMRRAHPAVGVLQDADRRLKGWLAEFGMSPSARTRVRVEFQDAGSPLDEYLDQSARST
jgi:phage terminase small subunit